jgi:hypothetical protein
VNSLTFVSAKDQPDLFLESFISFAANLPYISSLYSSSSLAYYRQQALDIGADVEDLSSILLVEGEPHFAYIGFIEKSPLSHRISVYENPSLLLDPYHHTRGVKKVISSFLRELLLADQSSALFCDPLFCGRLSASSEYLLAMQGASSEFRLSKCIDLSLPESTLKTMVRKSYASLINWGLRHLRIEILSAENISWDRISIFRSLHISQAGRETRTLATWEKQYESIISGESFCVFGYLDDTCVSAGFFPCSNRHCYYGVSASRRDMFDKPMFHALLWSAVLFAKNNGCLYFELGRQYVLGSSLDPQLTTKEVDIARFKGGFGGYLSPSLCISF